jgi:hypothetical protein
MAPPFVPGGTAAEIWLNRQAAEERQGEAKLICLAFLGALAVKPIALEPDGSVY